MTNETVSIRISKHLHDQLRDLSAQTGIPIKRLVDRAIATQLAAGHVTYTVSNGGATETGSRTEM